MINPIERLAEVYKANKDCSWFLAILIKVPMYEVKHLDKIMLNRATRKAPKLVKVKVGGDVRPDPLYEKPFQPLT